MFGIRLAVRLGRNTTGTLASSGSITSMSSSGQQPQQSEASAKDMPAAATFTSPQQLEQEQPLLTEHEFQQDSSSATRASQQPPAPAPEAKPTGTLQDMDTNDLVSKRNQILWDQAARGQQPGLTLMQDKLGDNRQEEWGNEPTIMEPDRQN